jgi:hypothetical protein
MFDPVSVHSPGFIAGGTLASAVPEPVTRGRQLANRRRESRLGESLVRPRVRQRESGRGILRRPRWDTPRLHSDVGSVVTAAPAVSAQRAHQRVFPVPVAERRRLRHEHASTTGASRVKDRSMRGPRIGDECGSIQQRPGGRTGLSYRKIKLGQRRYLSARQNRSISLTRTVDGVRGFQEFSRLRCSPPRSQ